MGDFAQEGDICTLPRLGNPPLVEGELRSLARERPIALILPCHLSDFGQPALEHICTELAGADWLSEIVFSLNGFAEGTASAARSYFARLPQRVRVLWNDDPRLREIYADLLPCAPAEVPAGKGLNVWSALGLLEATTQPFLVAVQDCDVRTFRRETLARLCFPCMEPQLNFSLAKMYYPRVTDRLYGRVSRLFLAPLLRALTTVVGPSPLLRFLRSFRYPLAGEVALRSTLARQLSLPSGWALEVGLLCATFREVDPHGVCQVDGGDQYDHKHQSQIDTLTGMCQAMVETLLAHLASSGAECRAASHLHLREALAQEGQEAIRRYAAVARLNGLPYARQEEEALTRHFATALHRPAPPSGARPLPPWATLLRERRSAVESFIRAATAPPA